MGAMARQVLQVKRKNSTNCNSPEARLTELGSVAWRSGPREVATGRGVGARDSMGAASTIGDSATGVALGATTAGGGTAGSEDDSEVSAAGAHEANRTASRLRLVLSAVKELRKRRFFTSGPFKVRVQDTL